MIATILPSSPTFHAVAYNESKVAKGVASLLEIKNFGPIDKFGYSSPDELRDYLIDYSSRNSRIKQPQFHLAISCKGHEYTEQQLVDFAHRYLDEMGYGDPDQPLLIYAHRDTDNTHIHIVTSRVDPRGKKIKDSNEKRRSQKVIDKIMNTSLNQNTKRDIDTAMQFDFRSLNQFKAVMEAMKYECYEKDGLLYVKKGGMAQTTIDIAKINSIADRNKRNHVQDVARYATLRAIFKKYRDANTSRAGLEKDLKKLFGISLVCLGKTDSPYGYFAVDFRNKKIIEGARILKIQDLFAFTPKNTRRSDIETEIDNIFEANPYAHTFEVNDKLRNMGVYVKNYKLYTRNGSRPLSLQQKAVLERNNKIWWLKNFGFQSEAEREVICKITGFNNPELVNLDNPSENYKVSNLIAQLRDADISQRTAILANDEFRFYRHNDRTYIYSLKQQEICDLEKAGFSNQQCIEIEETLRHHRNSHNNSLGGGHSVESQQSNTVNKKKSGSSIERRGNAGAAGSGGNNREWEVKKGYDEDDQDRKTGMSY